MNNSSISGIEFKHWLLGFLEGKQNNLPNEQDWVLIKKMLNKIQSDTSPTYNPWTLQPYPTISPPSPPDPYEITCRKKFTNEQTKLSVGELLSGK